MKKYFLLTLTSLLAMSYAHSAAIKGKVNFEGTAPTPAIIPMNADPFCQGMHPQAVTSEEIIVNANNTLKNVFIYVKEGVTGEYPVPQTPVTMDQKGCHYEPHIFGIQVGQTFEIHNSDNTLHNVHALPANSTQFNLGMPIPGMKLNKSFSAPEVMVRIKCDVHPWMGGYIGVLNHPFYSVSNEEGTFEIKDLPAGNYVLEAWHEKYGTQTLNVTVESADVDNLAFTYKAA